ncbi:hypothetical protein BGZ73_002227 [Actinomortierella ambigua]|nr:hypothetical protein BGZ73_002227 [Actinomortierella ambigua]
MKTSTVVAATVGALAVGFVGYAIYFDSKRRNDPEFRRKLKKERKRLMKQAKEEQEKKQKSSAKSIEEVLAGINEQEFPTSMEEREKFCMEQLSMGEALFTRGPEGYEMAAICFYKALKVYPSPAELVMVYQKTVPPEVFTLVMEMLSIDVHKKQAKYYTVFPPSDMNVKVKEIPEGVTADGQKVMRRGLVVTKGVKAGEVIFSEAPIISALEPSLEGLNFCHYCLKEIVPEESKVPCADCTKVVYCSEKCMSTAKVEFHAALCTKDEIDGAKKDLFDYSKETNSKYPEMIAKFLVRMVHEDSVSKDEEFNLFDHIERLRFLEVRPSAAEQQEILLLKQALGSEIPGLGEFVNEERYLTLKGKLLYNAYGVSTSMDADRAVEPSPEKCRSVHDAPVVGAGFYRVTSYMSHSCDPNAKITFPEHTHNLTLVATKDIEAGEELHVGFIDQKNGSLSTEQRRQALFQHYRFKCMCPRCEAPEETVESVEPEVVAAVTDATATEAEVKTEVEGFSVDVKVEAKIEATDAAEAIEAAEAVEAVAEAIEAVAAAVAAAEIADATEAAEKVETVETVEAAKAGDAVETVEAVEAAETVDAVEAVEAVKGDSQ